MTMGEMQARREIVETATAMLSGTLDLVMGCRRLCELRHMMVASDSELFLPIIGFESETDCYPVGSIRDRCAANYLQRVDRELQDYVKRAGPAVLAACKRIIDSLA